MLAGGGYIDNSNMITGSAVGIVIDGTAGTVPNSGTIGGGAREPVEMHQGGTLTNTQSASCNLVALEPGYSITGSITGSGTAGATNTLQLAGSAGTPLTVEYNGLSLGNLQDLSRGSVLARSAGRRYCFAAFSRIARSHASGERRSGGGFSFIIGAAAA